MFVFLWQADPPDVNKIPVADALGVTVVLLTCSYRNQEFVRVGYFINNEYNDPELRENPPAQPQFDKVSTWIDHLLSLIGQCVSNSLSVPLVGVSQHSQLPTKSYPDQDKLG